MSLNQLSIKSQGVFHHISLKSKLMGHLEDDGDNYDDYSNYHYVKVKPIKFHYIINLLLRIKFYLCSMNNMNTGMS